MTMNERLTAFAAEDIEVGDLVCFNADGKIEKWKPGNSPCLGALPPSSKIDKKNGTVEFPAVWSGDHNDK